MNKTSTLKLGLIIFALLVLVWFTGGRYFSSPAEQKAQSQSQDSVYEVLSSEQVEKFARVYEPRKFVFPKDYGPHPEYQIEWWYFTGNLQDQQRQDYGYELTFFRFALTPDDLPASESNWRSKHLYMAHFAVTDANNERFHVFDKFSRDGAGLAGAKSDQYHVWLHHWSAKSVTTKTFPIRVKAEADKIAIDLLLQSNKPMVLQGDNGFSAKSDQPGNASYYYSYTRLETQGQLRIKDEVLDVQGTSWMDREWSTTALAKDQQGWDWFALQLSDESEIMFYQLRKKNGQRDLTSSGAIIPVNGNKMGLAYNDLDIKVLDYWKSPHSHTVYPSKWQMSIPLQQISLDIVPIMNDQELNLSFRYWEGAVKITGTKAGQDIVGKGYVEMTGYGPS